MNQILRPIGHFAGYNIAESLENRELPVVSKLSEAKSSLKNAL